MTSRSFIILFVLFFSCNANRENSPGQVSPTYAPDTAAVDKRLRHYYEDMSARDWKKYKEHFWANATITTAWTAPGDSAAHVDVTTIDDFIRDPDSQPIFEEKIWTQRFRQTEIWP